MYICVAMVVDNSNQLLQQGLGGRSAVFNQLSSGWGRSDHEHSAAPRHQRSGVGGQWVGGTQLLPPTVRFNSKQIDQASTEHGVILVGTAGIGSKCPDRIK